MLLGCNISHFIIISIYILMIRQSVLFNNQSFESLDAGANFWRTQYII